MELPEEHVIAIINLDEYDEVAVDEIKEDQIQLPKLGSVKIYVYDKEGKNIPHIHLEGTNYRCCVTLYDANYFIHPGKEDTLNSRQIKALVKWFDEPGGVELDGVQLTNWQNCCYDYDRVNETTKFNIKNTRPDYINGL